MSRNRTRRCLIREGLDGSLADLGDHTIGDILSLRSFGPRCIVDLLSALESPRLRPQPVDGAGGRALDERLTAAARRLAALPEGRLIHRADPRFGALIEAVDAEAATAAELAERLLGRLVDPLDVPFAVAQVEELRTRLEGLPHRTIEQELKDLFANTSNERNRQILVGYYGWEDGRPHTLTEIGHHYGVTRERIRQVCAKLTRKPNDLPLFIAPVMDRALDVIHARLPCAAATIESELSAAGLTAVGLRLENIAAAARVLMRDVQFRVVVVEDQRLAVTPATADLPPVIVDLARKELYFHGLTTVKRVERLVAPRCPGRITPQLIVETLQALKGFAWLDAAHAWFRLDAVQRHGLPKTIEKILAVAGEVSVAELREALGRNRRLWKDPPPNEVLLAFCRQMPQVRVDGQRIVSDPPRDWRQTLTGVEAELVRILHAHGPVMERNDLEDRCVTAGVNRFSFHAFVSWSPVIRQFGHSVYGLLGTRPTAEKIDALSAVRRAQRVNHRVLDDHGRSADGKVWLAYRLSKAASTYAVVTIPAALKDEIHGRFTLVDPAGQSAGTLATKDGRAWGLGAMLRRRGAQIGDRVVVTLDLETRTATVDWQADATAGARETQP